MDHWPQYVSHKTVRAAKIVGHADTIAQDGKTVRALFVEPYGGSIKLEEFTPTEQAMALRALPGWYAVEYADGFKSVSPPEVFEAGYSPIGGE